MELACEVMQGCSGSPAARTICSLFSLCSCSQKQEQKAETGLHGGTWGLYEELQLWICWEGDSVSLGGEVR